MIEDVYRQLQQRLDLYSMGFPATDSGVELKILRYLFSENDAHLFLALTPKLEAPQTVADRRKAPVAKVAAHLEDMAERGLLFRLKQGNKARYAAIPFVHGLFEFQVTTLDRELSQLVEQYFEEGFDQNLQDNADYFLRTIPVQKAIDVTHHVASYEDAVAILQSKKRIVVADCICRKRTEILNQGCGKPMEACFMFGSMGQYYLDRGMGREVGLDEAVEIVARCQAAGLVTQPATSQNPSGMCNCCGDCCGVLRALNKHPRPVEMVFSNHLVQVTTEDCTGCEACLDRCQMKALYLNAEGLAAVNPYRCIGCGLCVTDCPTEAIKLIAKPDATLRVPPTSMAEQMRLMAQKRGLL